MKFTFTVEGKPRGKGRPRFAMGRKKPYTPESTRQYEEWIRTCYLMQKGPHFPAGTYIGLVICACFPIPKNKSRAVKAQMISGALRPAIRPDGDNIEKAVADALIGMAYDDDKQLISVMWEKRYTSDLRSKGGLTVTVFTKEV